MKPCESNTPTLPAIGSSVIVIDAQLGGFVRGHAFITPEGQQALHGASSEMVPVVIVQIRERITVENIDPASLYLSTITVHPDNLTAPLTEAELALLEQGTGDRPPTIGESHRRRHPTMHLVP